MYPDLECITLIVLEESIVSVVLQPPMEGEISTESNSFVADLGEMSILLIPQLGL